MNQNKIQNNYMESTGRSSETASSGRISVNEQRKLCRNQATARMKWTKELYIFVLL